MEKETWLGIGSILGVLGLGLVVTFILFHFFGAWGAVLWWPVFLGGFYLLNKYGGGK